MGRKALLELADEMDDTTSERFEKYYDSGIVYNYVVGNIYTGSLYLSLLSFLEQGDEVAVGSRIGLFSYGSGAVGEFFVGEIQAGYKEELLKADHEKMLEDRTKFALAEYERVLSNPVNIDEEGTAEIETKHTNAGDFIFAGIQEHKRQYKKL